MNIDVRLNINDNNHTVGCYELETNINLKKIIWFGKLIKLHFLFNKWLEQHNKYYYTPQEYIKKAKYLMKIHYIF